MSPSNNRWFGVLGIEPGASQAEIREAYLASMMAWHPDRHAHSPKLAAEAERRTQAITTAYRELTVASATNNVHATQATPPKPTQNTQDPSGHKSYNTGSRSSHVSPPPADRPEEEYLPYDEMGLDAVWSGQKTGPLLLSKQNWMLFFQILGGALSPLVGILWWYIKFRYAR